MIKLYVIEVTNNTLAHTATAILIDFGNEILIKELIDFEGIEMCFSASNLLLCTN
mgnify:CR=1 FL=1